jgi:hypothetical protein
MPKTFIDSGVLISAWRSNTLAAVRALIVLNDPQREFVSSPFVQLELLPKPQFFKRQMEVAFYERYFAGVRWWARDCEQIVTEALKLGSRFGLNALDAMHITAAHLSQADEFVTAERPASPFSRVTGIKIIYI